MKEPLMQEPILDHGFVELLDVMGSDEDIVNAARTSYDKGTRQTSSSESLIRYLMRHQHTSPFEFGELIFRIRCPFFVARQWFRHRTGSYNEVSLRYSEAPDDYYVPKAEIITTQDSKNKQARTDQQVSTANAVIKQLDEDAKLLYEHYQSYLEQGVAREIARINLPLSLYTTFMFKMDLKNLMHFLRLRFDSHAQLEIRLYAIAMTKMTEKYFPITINAWKDYQKESITFSKPELGVLRDFLSTKGNIINEIEELMLQGKLGNLSKGEQSEFVEKIHQLMEKPES